MVKYEEKVLLVFDKKGQKKYLMLNIYPCHKVKTKLHATMQKEGDFDLGDEKNLNPSAKTSISNALRFIGNPVKCCKHVYSLIQG